MSTPTTPTICIKVSEKKIGEGVVTVTQFEHVKPSDRWKKVRILHDVDIQSLGTALFALVEGWGHKRIVVNFANASFMSSAMLGKLITLDRKVKNKKKEEGAENSELFFCDVCRAIYDVFEITRTHRLFNIQEDERAALEQFSSLQL